MNASGTLRRATLPRAILALVAAFFTLDACAGESCEGDSSKTVRPGNWSQASHCPGVAPDYDRLFDQPVVHSIDIVISSADHQATLDDLDGKYSGGSLLADLDALPTPMWVPATIHYDAKTWTQVGMRYKGHSSLKAAWQGGVRKLSFILDFDHYEDLHQELENQRFFGFNKLSFSNAFNDRSLIREKVAGEVFRAGGVPAARSAFARVQLDWGEGPAYLGLYTLVEDPCDAMLKTQVGDGSGKLYKPWGNAARWLSVEEVGQSEIATYFETCGSADPPAGADVVAVIESLHQDRTDAARWRASLDEGFDVQSFLKTLAVNQVIMNWDSYGCMHHNYFVYANPLDQGRFLWFPWDLNESMLARAQAGCPAPGSVMLDEIALSPSAQGGDWPLIQFILGDPEYRAAYRKHLRGALDGAFSRDAVVAKLRQYHDLIAPFVVGPTATEAYPYTNCTQSGFQTSLTSGDGALEPHVESRHAAVEAALATP